MSSCKRKVNGFRAVFAILVWLLGICFIKQTAEASFAENPYVTFSPDGNAFTTNADETDTEWYTNGYTVYTGKTTSLREVETGEHIYPSIKKENVPVGKWVVTHPQAKCIHDRYLEDTFFHGVSFGRKKCLRYYYSGWTAYCADCNQKIVDNYFYMSSQAAASIKELDMTLAYYYRCPWCTNLEMGVELKQHICQDISANQYSVRYHANFGRGYMPKSIHMYNNASFYEGEEIAPQKNLTLNSFSKVGYEFIGWNEEQDGSGRAFADGEEILNLCTGEQDSIILYAQWKKCESDLYIDPNGGLYKGSAEVQKITGLYGSSYALSGDELNAPSGARVSFDTMGGESVPDIVGELGFAEWSFRQPLHGQYAEHTYTFRGANGMADYATAVYQRKPIILPVPQKEGYSFGGWYYDREATQIAGAAGEEFLPVESVTLYAYWVDLQLTATDNYEANGGKGAVNLAWEQKDSRQKSYLIYQKRENGDWQKIHSAEDISTEKQISKEISFSGTEQQYTVPYSGYYRLTLLGAEGQNFRDFSGGKGGSVTAVIYLEKGENLEIIIGGQDGYNGGGIGSDYGHGGGYTSVSTADDGLLLIAGGGGGATSQSDGLAGGSKLSNVSGNQGENGAAGGGGGYHGGTAGNVIYHEHSENCAHVHSGTPDRYGGCYIVPEKCNNTEFEKIKYRETFYYGNIDDYGNHQYCVRCGSHECPGHRDSYYRYECTLCGASYNDIRPVACTAGEKYVLGCDRTEEYVCGYENEQMIESVPAYGGSNYIKPGSCLTFKESQGVNAGNGSLRIEALHIGFMEQNYLDGVIAADKTSPDKIDVDSVEYKAITADKVNIYFDKPADRGTVYYHMAESYDIETKQLLSTSNQTQNTLTSGVYGYRYCFDTNADTVVTEQDSWYAESGNDPYINVSVGDADQYLHIAAVDKTGNVSETVHIPVSEEKIVYWPVITEQMSMKEANNVHKYKTDDSDNGFVDSDRTYYVKADGRTPFMVAFNGLLCGNAEKDYQINQLHFLVKDISENTEEGTLKIVIPMKDTVSAGSYLYQNEEVLKQYENAVCLEDASFTQVRRSDYCKKTEISQSFKIAEELDGHRIRLFPQAGVITDDMQVVSERQLDEENGVWLLADGQKPIISGLDIEADIINNEEDWEYPLTVKAEDYGSGLRSFWLEIRNLNNGGVEIIEDTDGDGCINLQMSSENALFWGGFTILAGAEDNVGNEASVTYGMDGIFVNAYIEKSGALQETVFKKGESGILNIQAFGYVDRLEVIFPKEWSLLKPELDRVYYYDGTEYSVAENIEFMVPLSASDKEYHIIVRAYKGESMVEASPELLTITARGSILQELRTRLR